MIIIIIDIVCLGFVYNLIYANKINFAIVV